MVDIQPENVSNLKDASIEFIKQLETSNDYKLANWAKLVKYQFDDLKGFFAINESSIKTPSGPSAIVFESNFHFFTPVIDETAKLRCTFPECPGLFGTKRAYEYHVQTHHNGETLDRLQTDRLPTFSIFY